MRLESGTRTRDDRALAEDVTLRGRSSEADSQDARVNSFQLHYRGQDPTLEYGGLGNVYTRFRTPFEVRPGPHDDRDPPGPYLQYIRRLSVGWQHLRYLADFMTYSTTPTMGERTVGRDPSAKQRRERLNRTHVSVLSITHDSGLQREDLFSKGRLTEYLTDYSPGQKIIGRLFVVEDISATVIEQLGAKFDIDPHFWRGHINDCIWYSPRDPTVQLPDLDSVSKKRSHYNIRYVQGRYFETEIGMKMARVDALKFNVLRRMDTDHRDKNVAAFRGYTGLQRSKVSIWTNASSCNDSEWTGIILIDPTIQQGDQLWTGYGKITLPPSMDDQTSVQESSYASAFEDFIQWTQDRNVADLKALQADPSLMLSKFYTIVCMQWLLISEYTHSLLNRFEWTIEGGLDRYNGANFDGTLKSLLTLRRRIPAYSGYIQDAIRHISYRHDVAMPGNIWTEILQDFKDINRQFEILQDRADRGLNVAVAVTAREDSKKATQESHAVTRVTYLAFIFVPLSFVASFLSMSGTFPVHTYWIYFATALPLSAVVLLFLIFASYLSELWDRIGQRLKTAKVGEMKSRTFKNDVNKLV